MKDIKLKSRLNNKCYLLIFLLLLYTSSFAENPSEVFLQDCEAIKVVVADLPEWMTQIGLSKDMIEEKVAFVLRSGGLSLSSNESGELLTVRLNGMVAKVENRNFGYFFSAQFELLQLTNPIGTNQLVRAITWSGQELGISPDERLLKEDVFAAIRSEAESLTNAILSAKGR
jgi:hypothetical protein